MMKRWLVLAALAVVPAQAEEFSFDVPAMQEEAAKAGIDHIYGGPFEFFVGGGAASFDCNGDRMPDVFLAGGANPSALYINRSKSGGALAFEKFDAISLPKVTGAYPLDIDGDGNVDLAVLRLGQNVLLRGRGDCTFEKANRFWNYDGGRAWTTGFSATWEKDQKFPTLAFVNYIDRTAPGSPWGTCEANVLARPGKGDVPDYSLPQSLEPGHCALSAIFTDWNNGGEPALRITNDRQYYRGGEEQLWRVSPKRPARPYRRGDGWQRLQIWGMGIAEHDLNGDGRPSYALTSMGDTKLQVLDGDAALDEAGEDRPVYRDMAFDKGATAHRPYTGDDGKPSTGWHSQFVDLNNDARTDLFIAKGNVEAMPDFAEFDPDNLLLSKADGSFHEAGLEAGIALPTRGRGAVVEDFNADGMLDLLVVNRGTKASLFRNLGKKTDFGHVPMGNWLKIELQGASGNVAGIGARISVKTGNLTQNETVQVGGGHASGQAGFSHFGLGVAERASVRVRWPDGSWSHSYRAFANHHIVIRRDAPEPMMWFAAE